MNDLIFWKNWNKTDRFVYLFSFLFFIVAYILLLVFYFKGVNNLVEWEVVDKANNLTVTVDQFGRHFQDFTLKLDAFVVTQQYLPTPFKVNVLGSQLYLGFIILSFVLYATSLTFVKKMWQYSLMMTVLIAWLVLMKLDVHQILGQGNQYFTFLIILLYLLVTFIFYSKQNFPLLTRALVLLALTLTWVTVLLQFSSTHTPILNLTNYGILFPLILTILFFFYVGYEIIRFFLTIVTYSGNTSKNGNTINFVVISLLYLGNLVLMYLNQIHVISWELAYFNPFALLFISVILGFWGHQKRSELFYNFLPFNSGGAILYLAWALISIATVMYAFASYNSSLISVFKDAIIYSHLCIGFSFFVYVLTNFLHLLRTNTKVYKLVYQPVNTQYFTVFLSSIVFLFVLMSKVYYMPYYRFISAYDNFIGDIYAEEDQSLLYKEYFTKSQQKYPGNLKACYALASMNYRNGNFKEAIEQLESVNRIEGTPYTYALLAEIYQINNLAFQDSWLLKEGLEKFNNDPFLLNNYGLTYFDMSKLDSSQIIFKKAISLDKNIQVPYANLLAFETLYRNKIDSTILTKKLTSFSPAFEANKLAAQMKVGHIKQVVLNKAINEGDFNLSKASYLHNYTLHQFNNPDSDFGLVEFEKLKSNQAGFNQNLSFIESLLLFKDHKAGEAKAQLDILFDNLSETQKPYYGQAAGLLMLRSGKDQWAHEYFKTSSEVQQYFNFNNSWYYKGLTEFFLSDYTFQESLSRVAQTIPEDSASAIAYLSILKQNPSSLSEKNKYLWVLFNRYHKVFPELLQVASTIKDDNTKAKSLATLVDLALINGDVASARQAWSLLPQNNMTNTTIRELNMLFFKFSALEGNIEELKKQVNTLVLDPEDEKFRALFRAIIFQSEGKLKEAEDSYTWCIENIPNEASVYWWYSQYLWKIKENKAQAYDEIVEALHKFENDIPLMQLYCFISLDMNYENFATDIALKLSDHMEPNLYKDFYADFEIAKSESLKKFENW